MNNSPDMSAGTRTVMIHAKKIARDHKHNFITTEHVLLSILDTERETKGIETLKNMIDIDVKVFKQFITDNLSKYKMPKIPELSEIEPSDRVLKMLSYAGSIAKEMQVDIVDIDHVLLSILVSDAGTGNNLFRLKNIDVNVLYELIYNEVEPKRVKARKRRRKQAVSGEQSADGAPAAADITHDKVLEKYTTNLTSLAHAGQLDPVIGRDQETMSIIRTLCRRNKNNPVLIGEPGVGKTAIVELLAQKIVTGDVPSKLINKQIHVLDLTRLVAGTIYRGQFEERMKEVITAIQAKTDAIMFIDELHMLVGAGASTGSMDASNILKPALARGAISCIGATTIQEYKEYIEGDGALERRFQVTMVDQPDHEQTFEILKGIKSKYEGFHNVRYNNTVLHEIVQLCDRYLPEKRFPDKAIDVMDEVGAKVCIDKFVSSDTITLLRTELDDTILLKNNCVESQNFEQGLTHRTTQDHLEHTLLSAYEERDSVHSFNATKTRITIEDIQNLISDKTGVPVQSLSRDDRQKVTTVEQRLNAQVLGQELAVGKIASAIKRSRVGVNNPNKPVCSFLFLGPTGVGKTMLARTMSDIMFDSDSMKQYDMSEFTERHSISKLIGSPPGYVGYGEGGSLTEYVRHNAHCVLLFDEIEKAHPDVLQVFLQILEYGCCTDSEGLEVNFKNTIIIMTSNLGAHLYDKRSSVGFGPTPDTHDAILGHLKNTYAPEFINRFDEIVVFNKLQTDHMHEIVNQLLRQLKTNVKNCSKITIKYTPQVIDYLLHKNKSLEYGARPLKRIITEHVETPLAEHVINTPDVKCVRVSVNQDQTDLMFE